jgi:DNA-binding SARP family transcriptional activator/TolB-like protein/tetratricopeptide (TPR) repeat protein
MFRLRTFGGAALFEDDRPLTGPAVQRRRIALLALLAVVGDAGMSRDKLLAFLWPETDAERARHTLSQWLHLLRRDLRAADVVQGNADLRLNAERLGSDVGDFERAIATGSLDDAVDLYAGPFLDGFHLTDSPEFERWLDAQRESFARAWRTAAESVAARCTSEGNHSRAVAIFRRLAAAEPFEQRYALALMRALVASGDPAAALAHARVHAQLLDQEFGEPMPASVRALVEELETRPRPARGGAQPATAVDASPRPDVAAPVAAAPQPPALTPLAFQWIRRRRALILGAPIGFLLVLTTVAFIPRQMRSTMMTVLSRHANPLDPHLIVVAPLINKTGDSSLAVLGDMAAEWATQALVNTGELQVVDANSAVTTSRIVDRLPRLLRPSDPAVALAEELGAGQVVEGHFYLEGDSLRVQARLVDVASGRVRQTVGPITGPRTQPVRLVELLARRVAGVAAAPADSSFAGAGVVLSAPPSFEAYRETSKAWESYYRGDLVALETHVARALASDSTYMLPLVILGHVYSEQHDWRGVDSVARIVMAHRARLTPVERAGGELLEALARGDGDAVFEAAVELTRAAPLSPETRTHAAHLAVEANRPRDALRMLTGLDPTRGLLLVVPWYWSWKSAALHELGDFQGQREVAEQGLRQFPDNPALLLHLGRALGALGREEELRELMNRIPDLPAQSALHLAVLQRDAMALEWGRELAAHGHPREAARLTGLVVARLERAANDTESRTVRLRAMAMEQAEQWAQARELFARLAARDRNDVTSRGHIAVADVHLGLNAEADRLDEEFRNMPGDYLHGLATIWRARIAATRGDRDEALRLMARALDDGYFRANPYSSSFGEFDLHADPFFASIRTTPEGRRLLAPRG